MRTFLLALCYLICSHRAVAQFEPFRPGYLTRRTLLRDFAPEPLKPACLALERGDLKTARQALEPEVKKNPDNYLAVLAFMQTTTPEQRPGLLKQYQRKLTKKPTPGVYFAVALLYAYIAQDGWSKQPVDIMSVSDYWKRCFTHLQEAYKRDPDPFLAVVISFLGAPDRYAVVEQQIGRLAGPEALQAYRKAKQSGWVGVPPPKVPSHMSLQQLYYLRVLVSGRRADYLAQRVDIKTGKVDPLTPTQKRADAYFTKWLKAIDEAIRRRQSQP